MSNNQNTNTNIKKQDDLAYATFLTLNNYFNKIKDKSHKNKAQAHKQKPIFKAKKRLKNPPLYLTSIFHVNNKNTLTMSSDKTQEKIDEIFFTFTHADKATQA